MGEGPERARLRRAVAASGLNDAVTLAGARPAEDTPQTYLEHGRFACASSVKMHWFGLLGIIHGIFPFWVPFRTASPLPAEILASGSPSKGA